MNARILIVDDDLVMRRTMYLLLAMRGIEAAVVGNGTACLEALRGGFRGLILMDVMMPGLSGWATVRAIRDEGLLEGNLIVMLTAVPAPGEDSEGLEECVFDYLTKPFDAPLLFDLADRALQMLEP